MKPKEIRDFRQTYQPYNKPCCFEGYKLAVLFDEKDEVKRIGARWDANEQIWWMPQDFLQHNDGKGPGTVHEWLNGHNMIMGPYGEFLHALDASQAITRTDGNEIAEEYVLQDDKQRQYVMRIYLSHDVAHVMKKTNESSGKYMNIEDGRAKWDELVKEGYNRTINA